MSIANRRGLLTLEYENSSQTQSDDVESVPGSTRRFLSSTSINGIKFNRNTKWAVSTFLAVCTFAVIIGSGYIYLQHTFVNEQINHLDVGENGVENVDDDVPIAEAQSAAFVVPDVNSCNYRSIHPTNNSFFDSNITTRTFPPNPCAKIPTSFVLEIIKSPSPVFTLSNCPNFHPAFFKAILTIGTGTGVVGYGTKKTHAKKMAAEAALKYLFDLSYSAAIPDCQTLRIRCGA